MVEILIISILISVGLLTVANAINHVKLVNHRVMQSVIANQIATEWAEIMYQKRNSNFLEYYYNDAITDKNVKILNSCRLAYNFKDCFDKIKDECENGAWIVDEDNYIIWEWFYYIANSWWINVIKKCVDSNWWFNITNCSNITDNIYAICLNSWSWVPCNSWHSIWFDESTYGKFYRRIEWTWIYDMSIDTEWWEKIDSDLCEPKEAQEYRFCSRVVRGNWEWEAEICSTMTNFAEIEGTVVR